MKVRLPLFLLFGLLANFATAAPADRVIVISVDGLRPDYLMDLLANDTEGHYANFQRLVDEGASTFNARTDFSHTVTLPNHTSMVTGRPVLQPAGQANHVHHGYTSNSSPGPDDTLHNIGNPNVTYVASVFDVVHDHGLTTALYASKSKFVIYDQSYRGDNGAPDMIGADDGTDKIDNYYQASSGSPAHAAVMHAALMSQLASAPPVFTFVHYRDPDSAGHASTWGSAPWNAAVQSTDEYIGEIMDFIDANPVLMGKTVVIVTTDHGGYSYSHLEPHDIRDYTIPFFVWGNEVEAGADLYALNTGHRLDPSINRPDYDAPVQPIRNGAVGNLALGLLGLPAIAGSSINAAQDLNVAPAASGVPETASRDLLTAESYPNPFNGRVVVAYELARAGTVQLSIFDSAGKVVRDLETAERAAGSHRAFWDGRDGSGREVSSGVYFYRVASRESQLTGKLTFVR